MSTRFTKVYYNIILFYNVFLKGGFEKYVVSMISGTYALLRHFYLHDTVIPIYFNHAMDVF